MPSCDDICMLLSNKAIQAIMNLRDHRLNLVHVQDETILPLSGSAVAARTGVKG